MAKGRDGGMEARGGEEEQQQCSHSAQECKSQSPSGCRWLTKLSKAPHLQLRQLARQAGLLALHTALVGGQGGQLFCQGGGLLPGARQVSCKAQGGPETGCFFSVALHARDNAPLGKAEHGHTLQALEQGSLLRT